MGSICINQSSNPYEDLHYPIIKKIQKFAPDRQNALEKPLIHSELTEDAQELTQLEGILEDLEVDKKVSEDKIKNDDTTILNEQVIQNIAVYEAIQRLNEIVTQIQFQVELQRKCSVIQKINSSESETQTLKGILKTNRSKSKSKSKSNHSLYRLKQTITQKKVSFDPRILRRKANKIYI
ncbi:unnamed protein product [Paramecium octaurelia]|uniref:Uncharacterized protein n=1 Tax=Paramecium octaurelia TaxID=43137 RepID=A0A8S1Y6G0_PAROT|nr:unnamed protein product [Paramecium octaurelia]